MKCFDWCFFGTVLLQMSAAVFFKPGHNMMHKAARNYCWSGVDSLLPFFSFLRRFFPPMVVQVSWPADLFLVRLRRYQVGSLSPASPLSSTGSCSQGVPRVSFFLLFPREVFSIENRSITPSPLFTPLRPKSIFPLFSLSRTYNLECSIDRLLAVFGSVSRSFPFPWLTPPSGRAGLQSVFRLPFYLQVTSFLPSQRG